MVPWDEKAVFLRALALPKDQRDAFLKEECPDKSAEDRIKTLLLHHEAASDEFLSNKTKTSPASAPATPTQIDEFSIIHRLGEGGMGVVYLAEDTILGRRVALKVLARHLTGSEQALARFREEARSAAALNHPAIVPVYKFGRAGEDTYLVAEFVDGRTLADLIIEKRRNLVGAGAQDIRKWHREAAEIVATIADALDCAHRARIVHRDVKPSNILIDRERGPRLTDFGIAKHLTEENRTEYTRVIGSCHYMSPEQANIADSRVDQRSDIFSLGVVLYEMLGLRLPFEGATVQQVLRAVSECAPPRLRAVDRRIPVDLETICHKAIEKRPEDRYQTAAHVAADLRCFLIGDPILARPPGRLRRTARRFRRHRTGIFATFAILLFAALALAINAVQKARAATLGWIRINDEGSQCQVFLQLQNPKTFRLEKELHPLGAAGDRILKLPLGQYRITLSRPVDRAFAEFNVILQDSGAENQRVIRLIDDHTRFPTSSGASQEERVGLVLLGVLRRSDEFSNDEMLRITGGEYALARPDDPGALFAAPLSVDEFLIDARKVSNRQFKEFVDATGFRLPNFWAAFGYPREAPDLPVVGVTLEEAEAYARWRGKRLPTLFESQAASRGRHGDLYPMGNTPPDIPEPPIEYRRDIEARDGARQLELYVQRALQVNALDIFHLPGRPFQTFASVREVTGTARLRENDVYVVGRAWYDSVKGSTLAQVRQSKLTMPSPHDGFRCAKSAAVTIH